MDKSHPQYALAKSQMTKGGTVISFEIDGGKRAAFRFLNALKIIIISNNLGDAKSLATHPVTTTHKNMTAEARASAGITDGFVRLSVGLEDPDDLILDLLEALKEA
jgi:O-succinylhomoserine sulfhydrylase